jgi:hypothetical protein
MNMPIAFKPVFPEQGKSGMNVKELFAAMALQGILAGPMDKMSSSRINPQDAAKLAVEYADALMKAL